MAKHVPKLFFTNCRDGEWCNVCDGIRDAGVDVWMDLLERA